MGPPPFPSRAQPHAALQPVPPIRGSGGYPGTQKMPMSPPGITPCCSTASMKGVQWESPTHALPHRAHLPLLTTCTPTRRVLWDPQPPPRAHLPLPHSLYPPITSDSTRQRYKQEFDTDLKRYKQLCAEMDSVNDRLNQLSRQLDSITEDSPQYQVWAGGGGGVLGGLWGCCRPMGL